MDFSKRIALVTGAGKGIGQAVAQLLVERHADTVILSDINPETLSDTRKALEGRGTKIDAYVCDVSKEAAVNEMMEAVLKKHGRVDILINNAGIYNTWVLFCESSSDQWKQKMEVNVYGTMYCTRALLPQMLEQKYGRIVNIGSVAGIYGLRHMVDYSASKGAVIAFTKALAKEVAPYGVTVNSVSPGGIHPDPSQNRALSFMERSGSPRECAELIVFLASDEASYISGQDHQADGCRRGM